MELPQHYFPVTPRAELADERKRPGVMVKFTNYGSHTNVDLWEDNNSTLKFKPQYWQRGIKSLSTVQPCIPVYSTPIEGQLSNGDSILGAESYFSLVQDMRQLNVLTFSQKNLALNKRSNSGREFIRLKKSVDGYVDGDNVLQSKLASVQSQLQGDSNILSINDSLSILSRIKKVQNSMCLFGYNSDFYGGLVCHIPAETSSESFLMHAQGTGFTDLYLTKVSSDRKKLEDLPQASIVHKERHTEPMYQLTSNFHAQGGTSLVCARLAQGCSVFTVDTENLSVSHCNSLQPLEESPTSVCFSPFLPNEVVLSTDTGAVYLWDINSRAQQVVKPGPDLPQPKQWTCSYVAGHPRQLAVGDRESLRLLDHRTNFSSPKVVFQPSQSREVMSHEGILAAALVQSPHHVVLTDHAVLVLDQRFLRSPVLQWNHELPLTAPQYIQVHHQRHPGDGGDRDNTFLFVGAQQLPEVQCFPFNISSGQPLTAQSLPFRAGMPRDVFVDQAPSWDLSPVEKRLQSSLAGISVVPLPQEQGFTLYQMDSHGDLFYQPFKMDKSCPSLEFLSSPATEAVTSRCLSWLQALTDSTTPTDPSGVDGSEICINDAIWKKVFSQNQHSQTHKDETDKRYEFDYSRVRIPKCLSFTEHLPKRGANTKLLSAQRDGQTFGALLEAREKAHTKMRQYFQLLRTVRGHKKFKSTAFLSTEDLSDIESLRSDVSNVLCAPNLSPASSQPQPQSSKVNFLFSQEGLSDSCSSLSDSFVSDIDSSSSGDFCPSRSGNVSWKDSHKIKKKRVLHKHPHKDKYRAKAKRTGQPDRQLPLAGPSPTRQSSRVKKVPSYMKDERYSISSDHEIT